MAKDTDLIRLDTILARLTRQRTAAISYLTFLRDMTDNDSRYVKYKSSYGGHVLNLAQIGIENSLILYCNRVWDQNPDAQSIPNSIKIFRGLGIKIAEKRAAFGEGDLAPGWKERQTVKLNEIISNYESIKMSKVRSVIRIIRTESLAHLLEESRDRKKDFPLGYENHNINRNDFYKYSEHTIRLIDLMAYFRSGKVYDYNETCSVFQSYCNAFWDNLPILSEVENSV
ncbi:MAG: hypothetical protein AAGG56_07320 [Pseudomonadota bacterium]